MKHHKPTEPPVIAGRVPPSDLDAEAAVLSACILDRGAFDEVADMLEAGHFYSSANAAIFAALMKLSASGEPVDIVTVAKSIRASGHMGRVGASYLGQIVDATPAIANVRTHAQAVQRLAAVRRAIAVQQRNVAEGYAIADTTGADEWLEGVEASVWDATQVSADSETSKPLRQVLTRVFERVKTRKSRGIPTGLHAVDRITRGLFRKNLYILAARPGMGKSALALQLGVGIAQGREFDEHGNIHMLTDHNGDAQHRTVALFELEMGDDDVGERNMAMEARVSLSRLRDPSLLHYDDWQALTDAARRLAPLPIEVDDTPALSLPALRSRCRRIRAAAERAGKPLGAVIVDYLQLMKAPGHSNREAEVAAISSGLKGLAKELDVPVIALAQLNRGLESRANKRPMLADLRESGAIEQDADVVVFLYRGEYYDEPVEQLKYGSGSTELIWAKNRGGPTCTSPAIFLAACNRFEDVPEWVDGSGWRPHLRQVS